MGTFFTIIVLAYLGWNTAQPGKRQPSATAAVRHIGAVYDDIHSRMPRLRRIERHLEGRSAEAGSLEGYLDGKSLRRMVAVDYGEGGKTISEFYFERGNLIFAVATTHHYNLPIYMTSNPRVIRTEHDRFYIQHGRLIRWIDSKGRIRKPTDPEAAAQERSLFEDERELLRILHGPPKLALNPMLWNKGYPSYRNVSSQQLQTQRGTRSAVDRRNALYHNVV